MALTAFRMAQFANMTATLAAHDDAAEITVVHRLLASDAKPSRVGMLAESNRHTMVAARATDSPE